MPAKPKDHKKDWSLAELVQLFGGELRGAPQTRVHRVATLDAAGPGDLTFLGNPRYRPQALATRAAAILLPKDAPQELGEFTSARIFCDDPYLFFARVANLFSPRTMAVPGIHASAVVEPDAVVSGQAQIGPHAYIGHRARVGAGSIVGAGGIVGDDAALGSDCTLHPRVTLAADCVIGDRAIVHSGVVIGADGFGFARDHERWVKIPQTGRVVIGDDVEIGANTTIDRGALEDTVIEDGVKLDNQIQIGHNVHIGAHSALAGCVGVAGSARIGRRCTLAGGAILVGHIELADDVHISAATLVTKSILQAGTYTGAYPFQTHDKWSRTAARLRRIDDLAERLGQVELQVGSLPGAVKKEERLSPSGTRGGAPGKSRGTPPGVEKNEKGR